MAALADLLLRIWTDPGPDAGLECTAKMPQMCMLRAARAGELAPRLSSEMNFRCQKLLMLPSVCRDASFRRHWFGGKRARKEAVGSPEHCRPSVQ